MYIISWEQVAVMFRPGKYFTSEYNKYQKMDHGATVKPI